MAKYVFTLEDGTEIIGNGDDYYAALKVAHASTGRDTEELEVEDFYKV